MRPVTPPVTSVGDREVLLRALLLLERYSVDITHVGLANLGGQSANNRDFELLIAIRLQPDSTPGQLARATGMDLTAVSRSLRHLAADDLIHRRTSPADARSSLVEVTGTGESRIRTFERALADYFDSTAPLVKEVLDLLGHGRLPHSGPVTAMESMLGLASAGAAYADEVTWALRPYGITREHQRFALTLLLDRGIMRPSHMADELRLSRPSATALVHRLVGLGLARSGHDDPLDHRAVVVRLTERGVRAANVQLDVFARHSTPVCTALARTSPAPEEHT